jgi:hypothetical protein
MRSAAISAHSVSAMRQPTIRATTSLTQRATETRHWRVSVRDFASMVQDSLNSLLKKFKRQNDLH